MQRNLLGLLVLLLAGCVLLAGCTGSTPATNGTNETGLKSKYIIGLDGAYPPYSYAEKDGSFAGFDVDSARWIANKSGFEVEFQAQYFANFPPYFFSFVRAPCPLRLSRVSECVNTPHDLQGRSHGFPDHQPELIKPERAHINRPWPGFHR